MSSGQNTWPGLGAQRRHQRQHGERRARGVGVPSVANNAQHTVFGQRAGGPSLVAVRTEALVGGVMLNVGRVEPRDQHVHIEQEGRQDKASRNSFTSSSVTGAVPARTRRKDRKSVV